VSDYMTTCLGDREAGYYMTREPFGRDGDFITAPEVSQMFGELIGIWCVAAWNALGQPANATLCEIGPGRGTLMKDLLRTVSQLAPNFIATAQVAMVETSPRLTEIQKQTLAGAAANIQWHENLGHENLETTGDGPLILVANELFDALPIRQFVKANGRFTERLISLDDADNFTFTASMTGIDPSLLPANHQSAPEGTVFEIAPARSALMQMIAERITQTRGAALLIDYGHLQSGFGDTLQAMLNHQFDDVFAHPGRADLTSHVDFAALSQIASALGCK
ncbi:class I SAM-dependent methyltransferase, partial [Paraburkholderia aspalathi]|nr:class I SAM-dependent methyltransferase [Paraburkholderia aspalathi]